MSSIHARSHKSGFLLAFTRGSVGHGADGGTEHPIGVYTACPAISADGDVPRQSLYRLVLVIPIAAWQFHNLPKNKNAEFAPWRCDSVADPLRVFSVSVAPVL